MQLFSVDAINPDLDGQMTRKMRGQFNTAYKRTTRCAQKRRQSHPIIVELEFFEDKRLRDNAPNITFRDVKKIIPFHL